MKRLIKKNYSDQDLDGRSHILPTSPLYNPLGKGEENSEFAETDNKSYTKMFNENTMKLIDERNNNL